MLDKDSSGADGDRKFDHSRWAELLANASHPVRVQIIDALRDADGPLSANELFEIYGDEH